MGNTLQNLTVLLPCYSLEDLSLHRDARESEELLSAWSALFHPLLLARTGGTPRWDRADLPPSDPADSLIVVPGCSESMLPDDWLEEARAAGAVVLQGLRTRREVVEAVLQRLEEPVPSLDEELLADFFALGFLHLQVELLTRQLRYMSNLDETQFQQETTTAAQNALSDNPDGAREHLRAALDLLTEAREYFYPVETHLLDLTLVAPTTIGESFRAELAAPGPTNLLISGQTVQRMALQEPASLAALKEALDQGKAAIVGGEFDEREIPLLAPEAILAQLERGANSYDRYLDRRPKIFGRRRFGLSLVLPQILRQRGFDGALHFTLDDGQFPTGNQSKVRWQGLGTTTLPAIGRLPIDAASHESFLRLPEQLGDVMDLDHTATAIFAHWPGQASPWYRDLRRTAEYSPVFGRFLLVTDYFHTTEHSGQVTRYQADQYRSPYLSQSVAARTPDPISRWVRYHGRRAAAEAEAALATLADLTSGQRRGNPDENLLLAVEESLVSDVDSNSDVSPHSGSQTGLDTRLAKRIELALDRFANALPRVDGPAEKGFLLVNPSSFSRCVRLDVSSLDVPPDVGAPVERVADQDGRGRAVVEVPPMGFAWVGSGSEEKQRSESSPASETPASETPLPKLFSFKKRRWKKNQAPPPMAEENRLRNELFEVIFDPVTGAIRSIFDYATRGNRLAQQIAFRLPRDQREQHGEPADEDTERAYSIMAADRLSILSAGPLVAAMESRGRLLDRKGGRLARFVQTTRIERGSPLIELDIELDVDHEPGDNPWDSYYAARFAWGDATADLFRGASLAVRPTDSVQIESPHFLELRTEKRRTTILTGGLPYHRRFGLRKLDTLLIVRGETARTFRMAIGLDLPRPVPAALDFLGPRAVLAQQAASPRASHGWLFHIDSQNVIATHWAPLFSGGRVSGFRTRLFETEGQNCQVGLQAFRTLASARKTDLNGRHPEELSVEDDRVTIEIPSHGWSQVEGRFAEPSD